jgi:serine phosphatase RsbU (regulator of sigma subunit)
MLNVEVGVVHLPATGETAIGDAYCVLPFPGQVLLAVADGLGHGEEAERAAKMAMAYVQAHPHQPLNILLEGCHRVLRGTRGVVMALVLVDMAKGPAVHAGIGNIETRVVGADKVRRPITHNGILGYQLRKVHVESFPFAAGDLILMHSDGVSERLEVSPASRLTDPQLLASQLAHAHGKHNDDQTLLIARIQP